MRAEYQYKCRLCGEVHTYEVGGWNNESIGEELFLATNGGGDKLLGKKVHEVKMITYHLCNDESRSMGICDFIGVKKVMDSVLPEPDQNLKKLIKDKIYRIPLSGEWLTVRALNLLNKNGITRIGHLFKGEKPINRVVLRSFKTATSRPINEVLELVDYIEKITK